MSHPRPSTFPSSTISSSIGSSTSLTSSQTSHLQSRIAQKRAELNSLLQLRDLSAQLTSQIEVLGDKLSTLDGGFETVAEVMSNWGSVLGVLGMVGGNLAQRAELAQAQSREREGGDASAERPQTLVRIPVSVPRDVVDEIRDGVEGSGLTETNGDGSKT